MPQPTESEPTVTNMDAAEEIDVTPEMIEAGVTALCSHSGLMSDDVVVFSIFVAMIQVSAPLKRFRVVESE
jgi:hypothetical protein